MTIGKYIDENSSLRIDWNSPYLTDFRKCPLENEPGVDAKRIVDAAEALINACKLIHPLSTGGINNLSAQVQEQLEVIWCG